MDIELFRKLFVNKLIKKRIFNFIYHIHNYHYSFSQKFKWNDIKTSSSLLVFYKYYNYLYKFLQAIDFKPIKRDVFYILSDLVENDKFEYVKYILDNLENIHSDLSIRPCDIDIYQLFILASKLGRLEILKYLFTIYKPKREEIREIYRVCPQSGNLELVKWLTSVIGKKNCYIAIPFAAKYDSFVILRWLAQYTKRNSSTVGHHALMSGNLEVLKWLKTRGETLICDNIEDLILEGKEDTVYWIFDNLPNIRLPSMDTIAKKASLPMMKYFYDVKNCIFTVRAIENACIHGNIEILDWLCEVIKRPNLNIYNIIHPVIDTKQITTLEWLKKFMGAEQVSNYLNEDVIELAVFTNSNIDFIKWLVENSNDSNRSALSLKLVYKTRSLDALKYILDYFEEITNTKLQDMDWVPIAMECIRQNRSDVVIYMLLRIKMTTPDDSTTFKAILYRLLEHCYSCYEKPTIDFLEREFQICWNGNVKVTQEYDFISLAERHDHFLKTWLDSDPPKDAITLSDCLYIAELYDIEKLDLLFKKKFIQQKWKLRLLVHSYSKDIFNVAAWLFENHITKADLEKLSDCNTKFGKFIFKYKSNPTKELNRLKLNSFINGQSMFYM